MFFKRLAQQIKSCVVRVMGKVEAWFKQWARPRHESLVVGTIADVPRSKRELIAENALLRQQLIVQEQHMKRPRLSWLERGIIVLLASRLRKWKNALVIVQPNTVLRWHRDLFRLIWRRKSERKPRVVHSVSPCAGDSLHDHYRDAV